MGGINTIATAQCRSGLICASLPSCTSYMLAACILNNVQLESMLSYLLVPWLCHKVNRCL
jgi:hypothetical protein